MLPRLIKSFGFYIGLCICTAACADNLTSPQASPKVIESCMAKAAALHRVDLKLLKAIAIVESRMNPRASNVNSNGSADRGLMQINDYWLPTLAKFGIKTNDLYDPCVSAYVGAWILSHSIQTHGATWRAVGAYNSPTEKNRLIYAQKVRKVLADLH